MLKIGFLGRTKIRVPWEDKNSGFYISPPDTAELEASYWGLNWLRYNGSHVPAVILSDSERALGPLLDVLGEGEIVQNRDSGLVDRSQSVRGDKAGDLS